MTFWDNLIDFKRLFADGPFRADLYDDGYADKAENHALNDASRNELDWVATHCRPAAQVLDLGCNTGRPLEHLCGAWEAEGRGLDVNARAIERARQDLPHHLFDLYDGGAVPLPENSTDHVMIHHVLGHVEDPVITLREAHRVLRDDGTLSIITPNRSYKLWQFPMNVIRGFQPDITVLRYYDIKRLRNDLSATGFTVATFETMGHLPSLTSRDSARLRLMVIAKKG